MSDQEFEPIRLLPLLSTCAGIKNLHDAQAPLLNLCLKNSVRGYFRVPEGQVAVVYEYVKKEPNRSLYGAGKPIVVFNRGPRVDRQVKYLDLDAADLQEIRDAGSAKVEGFLNGGLRPWREGLIPVKVEYGVLQKDWPARSPVDLLFGSERLLEGQVYPIQATIQLQDILISTRDAALLQPLIGAAIAKDKWGHREAAPSVYVAYRASQDPYDFEGVRKTLIDEDPSGVFNRVIAATVAWIMKRDVRPNARRVIAVEKITNNEMGKDYSDPTLSERMSLLLLATDCWIHDEGLRVEMQARLDAIREAAKGRELLSLKQRDELDQRVFNAEQQERAALQSQLCMPSGLRAYLENLGFSSNQAEHLYHVITQTPTGGRHVKTEKAAAEARGQTKGRRLKQLADNS